jgi:Carbohydrate-binding module 48 (Isoamylase N-terminal domain)/Putative esterase
MTTAFAAVLVAARLLSQQEAKPPQIVSPELHDDRRVTLRLWAPRAGEVQLSGDWMYRQPPVPLTRDEAGTWTVTVGPLEPNLYTYGFVVDGVRAADPACRCTLASAGRFASSRFLVRGADPAPWEERNVPRGTVHHEVFFSRQLQRTSRFLVYTPPDYRRSKHRYPVLVLLPGTPGVETDWTTGGGAADVIFDNLIADGRMAPAVVLMHAADVLPSGRRVEHLGAFEPMLVSELVPEVKVRYRVATRPQDVFQRLPGRAGLRRPLRQGPREPGADPPGLPPDLVRVRRGRHLLRGQPGLRGEARRRGRAAHVPAGARRTRAAVVPAAARRAPAPPLPLSSRPLRGRVFPI